MKERIEASARNYRGAAQGAQISDRYGQYRFKEYDPAEMNLRPLSGTSKFQTTYHETLPAHVQNERSHIVSPAFRYAHGLTQKYLKTAPVAF